MHTSFQYLFLTGVPFNIVDTGPGTEPSIFGCGASFDSLKSTTLALKLSSSRMLVAFMSQWKMGGLASLCRYRMPLADPRTM